MARLEAVIFDMDGVLIDSYDAHFRSWRKLAAERGREYSEDDFVAGFGRTSREVILEQWGGERMSDGEVATLADRKEALFRESLAEEFPAMPGAVELISDVRRAGIRVGVGSSGPPDNVQLVLERLGVRELVDAVVTGADVTRGKPDAQVFELVARRLGVAPQNAVVLEDAPVGIEAARRAGMKVIGVASTGRAPDELKAADRVVESLTELTVAGMRQLFEGD
ncbi:MAG TPA: HAD family phosphatase [Planctomycetaceae bacterium]|nr:HAD family phosphatase [Planctomycetaceae bacterium]